MITEGLDLTSSPAGFVKVGPNFKQNKELSSPASKTSFKLQKEEFMRR